MKKPVTKAKRKPRPPGTMAKAWETRRRNQALKAQRSVGTPAMFEDAMNKVPFTSMPGSQEAQRASAKMYREAADHMNEILYGDSPPGSFIEQYKTVARYKAFLENLGFTVSYDDQF